jgi:hypothetical protein
MRAKLTGADLCGYFFDIAGALTIAFGEVAIAAKRRLTVMDEFMIERRGIGLR